MLYIRMNRFQYGYEDYIVKHVHSLERFEDYLLIPKEMHEDENIQNIYDIYNRNNPKLTKKYDKNA